MRENIWKFLGFVTLLVFAFIPLQAATVITFDGILVSDNDLQSGTVTPQGFDFTSQSFHINNDPSACPGGCVDDGSQYLAVAGPGEDSAVTVTSTDHGPFSVSALDAAKLWLTSGGLNGYPNADTLDLTGTLSAGGTISISLTLPAEGLFNTYSLTGFTNLSSFTISGTGGGSTDASWAVDNLVVSEASTATPEPSTVLLCAGPLLALIAARYRKIFG